MNNTFKEAVPYWYHREVYNPETQREDVKIKNLPKELRDRYKPKTQSPTKEKLMTPEKKAEADKILKDPEKTKNSYIDTMVTDKNFAKYLKENTDKGTQKQLVGIDKLYKHEQAIHSQGRQPNHNEVIKSETIKVTHDVSKEHAKKVRSKIK